MRRNPDNWTFGAVYHCPDDPRIIVRNLLPFGWAWNFGHRHVYLSIGAAILMFVLPLALLWQSGYRSPLAYLIIAAAVLIALVGIASREARDIAD